MSSKVETDIQEVIQKYLSKTNIDDKKRIITFCFIPTFDNLFCYCGRTDPHYHYEKRMISTTMKKPIRKEEKP